MNIPSARDAFSFSVLALIFFILLTVGAFWLVWNNRGSEKIVTAVVPVAFGALLGIYLMVLVFGGEPPMSSAFVTSFFYRADNRAPLELTYRDKIRFLPLFEVESFLKKDPTLQKIDQHLLYHHLLQVLILQLFTTTYSENWVTQIIKINYPFGRQDLIVPTPKKLTEKSQILTKPELKKLLEGNFFEAIEFLFFERLVLPPKTKIEIKLPISDQVGEIRFRNPAFDLLIKTKRDQFYRGRLVGYEEIIGMQKKEASEYCTAYYLISMDAKFTRWRSGDPNMPKFKAWIQQVFNELHEKFDEERILEKVKADYIFKKQLPPIQPKDLTK